MDHKDNGLNSPIRTAVVTGGHPFDVLGFNQLFKKLNGVEIYIQHMDDFSSSTPDEIDQYDVILFYTMLLELPIPITFRHEDSPSDYPGNPLSAFEQLEKSKKGIFILHHSILAYPELPIWNNWVGLGEDCAAKFLASPEVAPPESITIEIDDSNHPITEGITDWEMTDEMYLMDGPGPDDHILLRTSNSKSMKNLGWVRNINQNRIFCWQSGHDKRAWENLNFISILERGIYWCASRI